VHPLLAQLQGADHAFIVVVALVLVLVVPVSLLIVFSYGFLWLKALLAGAHVDMLEVISTRSSGVPRAMIVDNPIVAVNAGAPVQASDLPAHFLAGGNVPDVTRALTAAKKAGIAFTLEQACAIDFAGRDVLEAVRSRIDEELAGRPPVEEGRSPSAAQPE
jgi:uncharacterized protein YqfA (UPF0365 family)